MAICLNARIQEAIKLSTDYIDVFHGEKGKQITSINENYDRLFEYGQRYNNGLGIYFSTDIWEAKKYGEFLSRTKLNPNNFIDRDAKLSDIVNISKMIEIVQFIIENTEDGEDYSKEDKLIDFAVSCGIDYKRAKKDYNQLIQQLAKTAIIFNIISFQTILVEIFGIKMICDVFVECLGKYGTHAENKRHYILLYNDQKLVNITKNAEAGYSGYSMSNNAVAAYEDGEKPLSKWSKNDIIDDVKQIDKNNLDFSKVPLSVLRQQLLYKSSWHHTSSKYNRTDFYSIDEDKIEELNQDEINNWIEEYKNTRQTEKIIKDNNKPKFVTASVVFDYWSGQGRRMRKEEVREIVHFKSDDKMVQTSKGNKRLSSLHIIDKLEHNTKYPDDKLLKR